MMKFSRILWKKGRNQSCSTEEIELTDMQLAAVQGAHSGSSGHTSGGSAHTSGGSGHHEDHDGYGHYGYGWYGGGYPSYYPSYYPYGYSYGYAYQSPAVVVETVPVVTQPAVGVLC